MSMPPTTEQPLILQRRQLVSAAMAGFAGTTISLSIDPTIAAAQQPMSAQRRGIYPGKATPPENVGYAPGNLVSGSQFLFVSGQGPKDLKADMGNQIRQTFDQIGVILKEVGATFDNVVMLRGYFVNLRRDLPVFRKVRLEYLGTPAPAVTSVGVTELAVANLEVELEAIAVV